MERPSLSMAIFLVVLILALLPISNADQAEAAAAKAKRGGPPELIVLNLVGRGRDKISLAMQPHDLSLAGFATGSHHWYTFPGYEHVIHNGTTLPFGNTNRDLIGGLANLLSLPLGREPALRAIGAISAGDNPASADEHKLDALKHGLAMLTVRPNESLEQNLWYIEHLGHDLL